MSQPACKRIPGGYQLVWMHEGLVALVKRIIDDRRGTGVHAEVAVHSTIPPNPGLISRQGFNLLGGKGKKDFAADLKAKSGEELDWPGLVEQLCEAALELHRQGEPIVEIGDTPFRDGPAYRLDPIIPEGQPAIIFGEGGTFKSYFALLVAALVQTGNGALGLVPKQGNVMYVDYETSSQEVNERLQAICRGLEHAPVRIPYRFCSYALDGDIEGIQDAVTSRNIDLVIVDSLGPACGADPNAADAIIRLFAALRSLRTSCLLIDHVAKNANTPTPFGSVYKINLARSVWELRRVQTATGIRVGLYHRKHNQGPLRKPLGFEIEFVNDQFGRAETVRIDRFNIKEDDDLAMGLSTSARILNALGGGKTTVKELAKRLNKTETQVRARLNDLAKTNPPRVNHIGEEWGLAVEAPF